MPPYTLDPGPHAGNYEATLTGTRQSNTDFDQSNFGLGGCMNIGGVYGAAVSDDALLGPELGVKYYVNESTFILA